MSTTVSTDSGRTERRSVRHRSEAQERIEAAAMEMEMQGTNEEAVMQVGSVEIALGKEELKQEHLQLELKWQQAAEALQAAQQIDSSEDESIGRIATLKDVLFEYGAICEFSESYSATTTGKLPSCFEDSDQAFSNLALIGAFNAQLCIDDVFGGSDFVSGKTVPQLLETWDK
jgi:hypothetical protein